MVRPPDPLTLARSLPRRFTSPLRSPWLTARLDEWTEAGRWFARLTP
ncbi:hypothetical protein [Dactylosporangium sp. CA-139066]